MGTVLAASLLTPQPASAATATVFYVDNSTGCSDSGSGTATSTPWCDFTPANAHTFSPGDQILLRDGDVWQGQLAPKGSGANGSAITISNYGTGSLPAIQGGGTASQTGAVYLNNQQYWTIQNLNVSNNNGTQDTAHRSGIQVTDNGGGVLHGITIQNNVVHDVWSDFNYSGFDPHAFGGIAVDVLSAEGSGDIFSGVVVAGNTVGPHDGRSGIVVWGSSWAGNDSSMYSQLLTSTGVSISNNLIQYAEGDSLLLYGTNGAVADHNTVKYGGQYNCQNGCGADSASVGIWPTRAYNTVISSNESYGESCNQGDGQGFDADVQLSTAEFYGNYSHDNCSGFMLYMGSLDTNVAIHDNVSQGDGTGASGAVLTLVGSPQAGLQFFNNTIYLANATHENVVGTYGGPCIGSSTPYVFENNIIDNQNGGNYSGDCGGGNFSHNVLFGQHPSGEPTGGNNITTDPQLTNPGSAANGMASVAAYRLQQVSPACSAGVVVAATHSVDFFGNPVSATAAPNIGADDTSCTQGAGGQLITNPGFETGVLSGWVNNNSSGVESQTVHSGSYAVALGASGNGVAQNLTGLVPNTTYTLSGWVDNTSGSDLTYVGVKNFGGTEVSSALAAGNVWTRENTTFTTGPSDTVAQVYFWKNSGSGTSYVDDMTLMATRVPVYNPGFEAGNLGGWNNNGAGAPEQSVVHSGIWAEQLQASNNGVDQTISGLQPNTSYVLSGWVDNTVSSDATYVGVKNFGGSEISVPGSGTGWKNLTISFTTGSNATSADVYFWKNAGTGTSYVDDMSLNRS